MNTASTLLVRVKKRLAQAEKRISELDRLFIRIYEDNVAGTLDDEKFGSSSLRSAGNNVRNILTNDQICPLEAIPIPCYTYR